MKVSVLAILTGLVACASAAPAPVPHVVHEKRSTQMQKWSRRDVKLSRDTIIPISIGLTQSNLDKGYEFLMDVSHPGSDNFGKHWSMEKIKQTFAPSKDTIAAVKTWLIESGIESERIQLSKSLTWVKFDATIEEAESLLKTEYNVYSHVNTGDDFLAVEEYSLPAHIQEHVDFITPTVHFDLAVKMKGKRTNLEGRDVDATIASHNITKPVPQIHPDPLRVPLSSVKFNLTNCNRYITPECLQTLYELPNGTAGPATYAVVEYTPQAYVQTDLDLFYSTLGLPIPAGTGPSPIDLIDGGVVQDIVFDFNYNGESNLDLSYAIGLLYPQEVALYQVGDLVEGASFNNFLDALDASYCSYEGGDDPTADAIYPDPFGGYQSQDCGTVAPAQVISTSYGYNEADLTATYEQRQCNEYMKLGLAGVSVLYSSGDYGVAGNGGECCVFPGCAGGELNFGGEGTFNPSFPGTCPYVTSVGATQVKHDYAVTPTVPSPEGACETVIYSGGGFSNVFPMPDYQANAVAFYYQHHTPDKYNSTLYNDSQKARGFPDVSANGANYVIAVDGQLGLVYGTSASSPVFGAIVTMINNERLAAGKGPAGFLNPTLYAFPAALNDITLGWNQGCGTQGFRAVKGWDPLTGLGTPNYPKLLEVFLALP